MNNELKMYLHINLFVQYENFIMIKEENDNRKVGIKML